MPLIRKLSPAQDRALRAMASRGHVYRSLSDTLKVNGQTIYQNCIGTLFAAGFIESEVIEKQERYNVTPEGFAFLNRIPHHKPDNATGPFLGKVRKNWRERIQYYVVPKNGKGFTGWSGKTREQLMQTGKYESVREVTGGVI